MDKTILNTIRTESHPMRRYHQIPTEEFLPFVIYFWSLEIYKRSDPKYGKSMHSLLMELVTSGQAKVAPCYCDIPWKPKLKEITDKIEKIKFITKLNDALIK